MPRAKKIQTGSAGKTDNCLPESRRFGGSPETDEAFDSRPIMDCHVGGVLVRDMPLLTQRLIHYDQTDEGFAEKNEGRVASVSVTDQVDKKLQQRRDDLRNGKDPRHAMQPLKFLEKHKKPGMRLKLLSTKNGELNPDYEPIVKPNGDVLKYKGMVVGERPEEDAQARTKFYQDRSATRLAQLTEKHKEDGGIVAAER
jgi:hypothetical protein